MTTGSLNWFIQQSGSSGGCSSKANISCIGRGWQFPIPTADEEGQNLQLHRTCYPMEGGVAALWCKKSVPSHIIQSKRGQGGGRRLNGLNLNLNHMNNNMEQPQALRNIPDEAPHSSHHPAAPAWLEVKGLDDKRRRDNIKRHSDGDKQQQQLIREEVIERKTTTLAVSLSSSDEEDSEHPNNDDEMMQNESCIEKTEGTIFPSSTLFCVNTNHNEVDYGSSSDSEEQRLASNNSCGKAERCLWNNREEEGFNNAATAIREQKSPPPFNNKNKLKRLVKTRDKEDECGGDDDNNKRAAALSAMQQQQLELPENSTTPKRKRLVKTTTTENANIQEEVIKSYEKEDEDELWSDNDEYESESIEYEHDDVQEVNYAGIQAGGGENNAIASSSSKDEITATPQLSSTSYWCNDSHSEDYFQHSSKRASVIVDLTSDCDEESDGTKHHLTPSQQSGDRSKYPVNDIVGPSQAESIGDFSEDDGHLKQVSGYKGRCGTYPNFKTVRQLWNCGGSNIDFNLMLKHQNGKVRTDSYEVRQRKRMAKKQQKKGKKRPRKSNAKVGKSGKCYSSAAPSRGLHNEGRGAVKRAHQWAPPDI